MTQSLVLKKPLTLGERSLDRLEFREPVAADLMEVGYPVQFEGTQAGLRVKIDAKVAGAMIAALTGISLNSVGKLSIEDFNAGVGVIVDFFGDSIPGIS